METILVALVYVGMLAVLILVGMLGTLYFYIHGALGFSRFREVKGLRAITARSVPYQVSVGAGQSEIKLGYSTDPGTRYARMKYAGYSASFAVINHCRSFGHERIDTYVS